MKKRRAELSPRGRCKADRPNDGHSLEGPTEKPTRTKHGLRFGISIACVSWRCCSNLGGCRFVTLTQSHGHGVAQVIRHPHSFVETQVLLSLSGIDTRCRTSVIIDDAPIALNNLESAPFTRDRVRARHCRSSLDGRHYCESREGATLSSQDFHTPPRCTEDWKKSPPTVSGKNEVESNYYFILTPFHTRPFFAIWSMKRPLLVLTFVQRLLRGERTCER